MMMCSDDQVHEKRVLDILSLATEILFCDEETRAGPSVEEESDYRASVTKKLLALPVERSSARLESNRGVSILGKRKRSSPQNPKCLDDASSQSLVPGESKKRGVVPKEPVREIQPVRGIKKTVRVRRRYENRVIQPAVIGEVFTPPQWLSNKIRELNAVDAKMIFRKELTATDVAKKQNRLLMPWKKIRDMDFLTDDEWTTVNDNPQNRRDKGVAVILLGSWGRSSNLNFRRWDMETTSNYVLVSGWHEAARYHGLKEKHVINLWTFHAQGRLYFAIVNLTQDRAPDQAMAIDAQPLAIVPAPHQAMAHDVLVPAPDQAMVQDARALALVPLPDQAMAQDAQPRALDQAMAQDALALALVAPDHATAQASSSARARIRIRVVRRNPDEQYICDAMTPEAKERRRRVFVDFPRRRRSLRVPVPPLDSESDNDIQTGNWTLDQLAKVSLDKLKVRDYESDDDSQSKVTPLMFWLKWG